MTLALTQEQYNTVKNYADAGNYQDGWGFLASIGDSYADDAANVASGNATDLIGIAMDILVEKHWGNTAGDPNAYNEKFDPVAKQHFQEYVRITELMAKTGCFFKL